MQNAELRISDTHRPRPTAEAKGLPDISRGLPPAHDAAGKQAKRLALLLMAASSLFMIGLIAAVWLIW